LGVDHQRESALDSISGALKARSNAVNAFITRTASARGTGGEPNHDETLKDATFASVNLDKLLRVFPAKVA